MAKIIDSHAGIVTDLFGRGALPSLNTTRQRRDALWDLRALAAVLHALPEVESRIEPFRLYHVRQVAQEREAFAVVSVVGRQVEMVLALADANGMLPRDRQRLERAAEAVVDGA